ncbi:MAG: hypothetical protein AAGI09_04205 [Pseudomonadota bacterium]
MPFKTPRFTRTPVRSPACVAHARVCALVCASAGIMAVPASAEAETRAVYLEAQDGVRWAIADLDITDGAYDLTLRDAPFSDHFLSMRPFKCLAGAEKHWCYVPYPYENVRNIGADFTDLEYDLLFLWKGAGEYGINMWNGVYYKIEAEGDRLVGVMHEMDMDILSAPPAPGNLRPVREMDLEPADPDSHWLPRLVIE